MTQGGASQEQIQSKLISLAGDRIGTPLLATLRSPHTLERQGAPGNGNSTKLSCAGAGFSAEALVAFARGSPMLTTLEVRTGKRVLPVTPGYPRPPGLGWADALQRERGNEVFNFSLPALQLPASLVLIFTPTLPFT